MLSINFETNNLYRFSVDRQKELLMESSVVFFLFIFLLTGIIGALPINDVFAAGKIDINSAPKEELQAITGIGPVLAQRIIDARPFSSVYDLTRVSGIGETTLQKITEQGLAWASEPIKQTETALRSAPQPDARDPGVFLSYPQNNPADKEIEVFFSALNLENTFYDVKISIEKERVLSNIYNEKQKKWQSSHYYINSLFSGSSFEGTFKLKIREEKLNFQGEADILARIREGGKSNYLEYRGKINIAAPESQPGNEPLPTQMKNLASFNRPVSELFASFRILLTALTLAIFSGITILALKTSFKK